MKKITLINANIYDGTLNMQLQENACIEIIDGKISKIGNFEIDRKSKVIDLEGKYVIPGLINLHVHLPSSGKLRKKKLGDVKKLVEFVIKNKLTKAVGRLLCKKQYMDALKSGVTTLRCVGGLADLDTTIRNKINKSKKVIGPRLLVSNTAIGMEDGHMVGTVTEAIHSIDEIKASIDRLVKEDVDLIKLMITGGVLDGAIPGKPGLLAMPYEFVKFACDYAHSFNKKVAAHVEGPEGMEVAILGGVDSIEHTSEFEEHFAKEFKERNGALVLTLSPAKPFIDVPTEIAGYGEVAKINSEILVGGMKRSHDIAKKYNIDIGLGTDAGSTLSMFYDFYRELIFFANIMKESNSFALYTGTLKNAEIAGISEETGSISVGKFADLVVVNEDPIKDLHALKNPSMVFMKGQRIKSLKIKRLKKEDEILAKYLKEN